MDQKPALKYFFLYIPYLLALVIPNMPILSYFVAWGGSFWIFYLSLTGKIKPIPKDLSFSAQFMRPLILTQIIFASYMSVTSVFHFLDSIGIYYFTFDVFRIKPDYQVELLVQCQQYYVLAHAAYVHGLLMVMNYDFEPKWKTEFTSVSVFMLQLTLVFSLGATLIRLIPGLTQFQIKFVGLSFTASVIALAYAVPERKTGPTVIALGLFGYNMIHAFVSGWKEEIIVPLIMLGVFVFPIYKRMVIIVLPVLLILFFTFIPAYNGIVRELSWSGKMSGEEAAKIAIEKIKNGDVDIAEANWIFFTGRLSEISMFTKYVEGVPKLHAYYGLQIIQQAALSVFPRIFYRNKPITEDLVMERVLAAGVVEGHSKVSAKPPMVTDAYLSAGTFGVFTFMLCLGGLASWVSVTAEKLFGGYIMGSGLIYASLFQMLWRGNCFEFLANSIFWSIVLMFLLFYLGKGLGYIKPVEVVEPVKQLS